MRDLERYRVIILSELKEGRENPTSTNRLKQVTGLDERRLRAVIHDLRRDGVLICSTTSKPSGYFLPAAKSDLSSYVDLAHRRGRSEMAAASVARRKLDEFEGQQGA